MFSQEKIDKDILYLSSGVKIKLCMVFMRTSEVKKIISKKKFAPFYSFNTILLREAVKKNLHLAPHPALGLKGHMSKNVRFFCMYRNISVFKRELFFRAFSSFHKKTYMSWIQFLLFKVARWLNPRSEKNLIFFFQLLYCMYIMKSRLMIAQTKKGCSHQFACFTFLIGDL